MSFSSAYTTDIVRNTPAEITKVIRLARKYAPDAIETLFEIMTDPRSSKKVRVDAAQVLLDRAMGRAPQLQFNVDLDAQMEEDRAAVASMARQVFLAVESGEVIDVTEERPLEPERDRAGETIPGGQAEPGGVP